MQLEVFYDPQIIDPAGTRKPEDLRSGRLPGVVRAALKAKFPHVEGREATRELRASSAAAPPSICAIG